MKDKQQGQNRQEGTLEGERLARFLAHAGVASRRHAEELIAEGRVQVNGITITTQGTRIDPERDRVLVDGRPVRATSEQFYILLHKPQGYVTTAHDPEGRSTVLDLLPAHLRTARVYPVGRLDRDTSGLLLLTNDGDFALRLSHPRYATEKCYEALVRGVPKQEALQALRRGVPITEDDGRKYMTSPAQVQWIRHVGPDSLVWLSLHEGHKRQVRRMFQAVGHQVLQLQRVAVGPLLLGDLEPGQWRYLTAAEVSALLHAK